MKLPPLAALCLCLLALPARAVDRVFTLDAAMRTARLNDAGLLSAEQDKIIAEQRVTEAKILFLPEVGIRGSVTKFDARHPFIGGSSHLLLEPDRHENLYATRAYMYMPLYEGRRTLNTLRLAQSALKQALSRYESIRMDIALSVTQVFYRLLLIQEKVRSAGEVLAIIETFLKLESLGPWERIEAEALHSGMRSRNSEAEHALDLARLAFLRTLNRELDTPFRVDGKLKTYPVNVETRHAVLWAMELRPELQAETHKATMDAIAVNIASARSVPTIFMAGDYGATNNTFPLKNNNWNVTLGIKLPFAFDYFAQVKRKRAEQRKGQLERSEVQDRVRLEVRQALEHLRYWQKEWPVRETQYLKIKKLYDATVKSPRRVLARMRALMSVLDLRLSYLASVSEHLLARARVERAVGRELPR